MTDTSETMDWLATIASRRELTDDEIDVAAVKAKRKLKNQQNALPKTIARESVNEATDEKLRPSDWKQ